MKSKGRKSSEATKSTKARKETPAAPVVQLVKPKAKAKGRKFADNWGEIPSSRMLLALVIRAWEAGESSVSIPTTREGAIAALGYEKAEKAATAA